MSVQELLSEVNRRLDSVATKDDISEMKRDVRFLTQTVTDKTEKFKERMFGTETNTEEMDNKMDKMDKDKIKKKRFLEKYAQCT